MFKASWTLGRVRGIPLRLHVSLLIIVPLIAWTVSQDALPRLVAAAGYGLSALSLPPVVWGVLIAVALFVGVALHELGHAFVALAQGGRVRSITLMLLGGVTEIDHEEATPGQQAWMAFAGPLVSLALAGLSGLAAGLVSRPLDLALALVVFRDVNLVLAVFNLMPAYPLDGGRILRALLQVWMTPERATQAAAVVGRTMAIGALVLAVYLKAPMLFLVGLFIYFGAGVEAAAITMRSRLTGLRAAQAMVSRVVTVGPDRLVAAVARHMLFHGAAAAIVRDHDRLYGVLVPRDLRRAQGSAADALSGDPLLARTDDDLGVTARALQRSPQSGAIVLDAFNTIVGVVTYEELGRTLALKSAAGVGEPAGSGQQPVEAETWERRR